MRDWQVRQLRAAVARSMAQMYGQEVPDRVGTPGSWRSTRSGCSPRCPSPTTGGSSPPSCRPGWTRSWPAVRCGCASARWRARGIALTAAGCHRYDVMLAELVEAGTLVATPIGYEDFPLALYAAQQQASLDAALA